MEIHFHLDMRTEELMKSGVPEAVARAQARAEFGDVDDANAQLAGMAQMRLLGQERAAWWDAVLHDTRHALRGIARQPGLSIAIVTMLGLGLGANAAMFSITDRLLLRPPSHVVKPESLRRVFYREEFDGYGTMAIPSASYLDYLTLREDVKGFGGNVAAYFTSEASAGHGVGAKKVVRVLATGNYFGILGARPQLGRFFDAREDVAPQGASLAVLSDAFWRREWGSDPRVLGQSIEVGNGKYTVIGVAPRGFTGVDMRSVDLWIPMSAGAGELIGADWATSRDSRWLRSIARLPSSDSEARLSEEATAKHAAANPRFAKGSRILLGSLLEAKAPEIGTIGTMQRSARISLWLSSVSFIVLIIAAANVANLLLARAVRRQREIAIRMAMGIGRYRLMLQTMTEVFILAVLGGMLGLTVAHWGAAAARSLLAADVEWSGSPLDGRVVTFTIFLVVMSALGAMVAPLIQTFRTNLTGVLKTGGREGGKRRSALRTALVLLQATLSVVLLVAAGLFIRSLQRVQAVNLGFDAEKVLIIAWDEDALGRSKEEIDLLYRDAMMKVRSLSGVANSAVATTAPFYSSMSTSIVVPGVDSVPQLNGGPTYNSVTPEYFGTIGTSLIRGRGFGASDGPASARTIVVNETMARVLWPSEDALGKCVRVGGADEVCSTVIGVAQDTRHQSIDEAATMQFYLPLDQRQTSAGMRALLVRVDGDPFAVMSSVRERIQSVAPNLPFAEIHSLHQLVEPQLRPWQLGATMFASFGALALTLAAIGLYSVIAYSVGQRIQEVSIRVALGARPMNVIGMVLGDVGLIIVPGVIIGLMIALAGTRRLQPLLFGVSSTDAIVFLTVPAVLFAVGALAALIPTRRALAVKPAHALRND